MHLAKIVAPADLAVDVKNTAMATAGRESYATVPAKKVIESVVARQVIAVRCP